MNIIDNEPLHTFTHIYTFDYEFFWSKIGQIRFSKLGKPYFKPLFSLMTSSSGTAKTYKIKTALTPLIKVAESGIS